MNIIDLAAYLTHAPAGDAFQHQRRIQRKMHHQRRPITVLPQQDAQVLRLRDGPGKPVKHKAMRTIRSLDALPDHFQDQGIRNQLAARHNRLHLLTERRP